MLNFLRISVSALALSAFVVAPVVTAVTADYAYANNGNGNGGGKGGGNGGGKGGGNGGGHGGDKGNSKSAGKSDKGWGSDKVHKGNKNKSANASHNGKSKNSKGLGRAVKDEFNSLSRNLKKNGIAGLFKGQTKQGTAARTAKVSVTESVRPPSKNARFKADLMHPSNLGKLNGAINSSPNAKAAHIANGQYAKGTGPVSLAAALAVADYEFSLVSEDYAQAVETAALADAFDTLDGLSPEQIADAERLVDDVDTDDNGVISDEERKFAIDNSTDGLTAEDIDNAEEVASAVEATEGKTEPDASDAEAARDTVQKGTNLTDAEDALLAEYKGDLPASEDPEVRLSEEEQQVVDAVRDANPTEETIKDALGEPYEGEGDDDITIDSAEDDATPQDLVDEEQVASNG